MPISLIFSVSRILKLYIKTSCKLICITSLLFSVCSIYAGELSKSEGDKQKIQLGQQLYFDQNLSLNRTQSCATCHAPEHGFVDQQQTPFEGAVSLGDDGISFGDRSAPTAAYANQIPVFHQRKDGEYIGGQFWDGREDDLKGQAGGPPLNPIEMGMPDKAAVLARIKENETYLTNFKKVYGQHVLNSPEAAYLAIAESIAAFEKTDFFSSFDSKYDRHLKGEYELTEQEDLGMTLFFSEQFSNCNHCHQLNSRPATAKETFSDYTYHNIGVPVNIAVRKYNNSPEGYRDLGLYNHPDVDNPETIGKFKVPTLRNVAVTGPYMHNGVFQELETVMAFYNKYNTKNKKRQINPETAESWAAPEISENISLDELQSGPALDDKRIDAIVSFLKLLTDKRYEHLLEAN